MPAFTPNPNRNNQKRCIALAWREAVAQETKAIK